MEKKIDKKSLFELSSHTRKLGFKNFFKSMGYERCAELPLITSKLQQYYKNNLKYLDIGSGESVLPTYFLKKTNWDITCVDKYAWLDIQKKYASKIYHNNDINNRFHLIIKDFLSTDIEKESFDIITNISVIEHFEKENDSIAMQKSASLLKPGGIYILTTLINEGFFKEFFINENVYGQRFKTEPVFYQRHYDIKNLYKRIIEPSGLTVSEMIFFGEYDYQFVEKFIILPKFLKPLKIFYQWATPYFSRKYMTYRDYPVSRPNMKMFTSSGVILIMSKN